MFKNDSCLYQTSKHWIIFWFGMISLAREKILMPNGWIHNEHNLWLDQDLNLDLLIVSCACYPVTPPSNQSSLQVNFEGVDRQSGDPGSNPGQVIWFFSWWIQSFPDYQYLRNCAKSRWVLSHVLWTNSYLSLILHQVLCLWLYKCNRCSNIFEVSLTLQTVFSYGFFRIFTLFICRTW
jgi:hypothetical protein